MWEKLINVAIKYPISFTSDFIPLIPIIAGIIYYEYLSKESRLLFYFTIIYFFIAIYSLWKNLHGQNNLALFNFSDLLEIIFISIVFYQLNHQKTKQILILALLLISVGIGIYKFDFEDFAYFPYVINRIFYLIFVFIYFHTLLSETAVKNILIHPPFWLCAGLIVYSTGSLLIFLFGKHLLSKNAPDDLFVPFYDIVCITNFICRILIGGSFVVSKFDKQ
jgi:hypothetical protein